MILLPVISCVSGQNNDRLFIIDTFESMYTGKMVSYWEKERYNYELSVKDKNGKETNIYSIDEADSPEKMKVLIEKVLSPNEIEIFKKQKGIVQFLISTDNEIVAVGFIFRGTAIKIPQKRLKQLAGKIKEEVEYKIGYEREVGEKGYVVQYMPVYRLFNEKNKPANRE